MTAQRDSSGTTPGDGTEPTFTRLGPPEHLDEAMLAFLRTTKFYERGRPLNAHRILSNHPPAGRALNRFLDWGDEAALSPREKRLLILRTSVLTRCAYEFNVHRQQGVSSGDLTEADVDRLQDLADPNVAASTDRESALLAVADAVCRTDTLDDAQWVAVSSHLTAAELIECLIVVGYYRMCAGLMNALAVPDEGNMLDPQNTSTGEADDH